MDTHERLRQLLNERGWTEYRLAKNCGLSESTIANIYRRNTVPSLATWRVFLQHLKSCEDTRFFSAQTAGLSSVV